MISAISWVPKGIAKAIPAVVEPPTKEEIEEIIKSGTLNRSDDDSDNEDNDEIDLDAAKRAGHISQALAAAKALDMTPKTSSFGTKHMSDALKELNMDNYDEEDDGIEIFSTAIGDRYYASNEMDPYLKKKDDEDDDDDEIEDMAIKATDAVIICARTDDDISQLQVCVFEELEDGEFNFYSHHDIILPAFPLCTAWLDFDLKKNGGDKGNFVAVGTMEPAIEIWDVDLIDELQPCLILGGVSKKKKKGKKKGINYQKGSHTDSVLGLDWNKKIKKYLASASADNSVKIWDIEDGKCFATRNDHTDKVQAVAWNPHAPNALLSGSFDHSVILVDMRYPTHPGFKSVVTADVECLAWDPHDENSFLVSLEDGTVQGFDVRTASSEGCKPSFTLHAHDKPVSSISFCPTAPKLLATGSTDKMVKLWDLSNNQPSCVATKNLKAGAVFSTSFSEDCPFLLAIGGSKGDLQVWDTLTEVGVARRFGKYSNRKPPAPAEGAEQEMEEDDDVDLSSD